MAINCGHCPGTHGTVSEVRACGERKKEANEVACCSCDGLLDWSTDYFPELENGARRGCGGPDICRRDFPASF